MDQLIINCATVFQICGDACTCLLKCTLKRTTVTCGVAYRLLQRQGGYGPYLCQVRPVSLRGAGRNFQRYRPQMLKRQSARETKFQSRACLWPVPAGFWSDGCQTEQEVRLERTAATLTSADTALERFARSAQESGLEGKNHAATPARHKLRPKARVQRYVRRAPTSSKLVESCRASVF